MGCGEQFKRKHFSTGGFVVSTLDYIFVIIGNVNRMCSYERFHDLVGNSLWTDYNIPWSGIMTLVLGAGLDSENKVLSDH